MAQPVPITQASAVATIDESRLLEVCDPVVTEAENLSIETQDDLERAGAFLTERIKPTLKEIAAACDPVVKAANEAHKAATAQRKKLQQPLLAAEALVKRKIAAYVDEQERRRREQMRREEEERRRAAEEEQLRRAAEAEAAGDAKTADRVLEEDPVLSAPPAPPPPPAPARVSGISTSKRWKAEVTDMQALVRAVADGKAPLAVLKVDAGKLNQQAQALDGQLAYPGVRVYQETGVSARAR